MDSKIKAKPLQVLGETLIHLDIDADINRTKKVPGSNIGGLGRIRTQGELIDRIEIAAKNTDKSSRKEADVLMQIFNKVKTSAKNRTDGMGILPANGSLAKKGEKILKSKLGQNWVQVIFRHL